MSTMYSPLKTGLNSSSERRRSTAASTTGRPSEDQLRTLMAEGLEGSAPSHSALLRAVRPMLIRFFARRIGPATAELEDLVQEVLLAVHERRASYDTSRPFTPWLFAVARYKLIDHYRRSRRDEPIDRLDDILISEGFGPRVEARVDVTALLATLPPKQQTAIRLTRLREMSIADAAAMAGIGESDVKVSAHRGIRALAARVARAVA